MMIMVIFENPEHPANYFSKEVPYDLFYVLDFNYVVHVAFLLNDGLYTADESELEGFKHTLDHHKIPYVVTG